MNHFRNEEGFCLYISFEDIKKKIFFPRNKAFSIFLEDLKTEFQISDGFIKLHENGSGAEINSPAVLEPNIHLNITHLINESIPEVFSMVVSLDEIKDRNFPQSTLQSAVNEWAVEKGFRMTFREGLKCLKKGYKRDMFCSVNGCPFKLTFKSDQSGELFNLDLELSKKYNKHKGTLTSIIVQIFI